MLYIYAYVSGSDEIEVSIMFSFQNGDGGAQDSKGGNTHIPFHSANTVTDATVDQAHARHSIQNAGTIVGVGMSSTYETYVLEKIPKPTTATATATNSTPSTASGKGVGNNNNNPAEARVGIASAIERMDMPDQSTKSNTSNALPSRDRNATVTGACVQYICACDCISLLSFFA